MVPVISKNFYIRKIENMSAYSKDIKRSCILGSEEVFALLRVRFFHLDPDSTPRVRSHMSCNPNLLGGFPPIPRRPRRRRFRLRIRVHIQPNLLERLHNPSNDGRRLAVRELLSKTYPWSSPEWQEYEWIRDEILLNPIIQESLWIELVRCGTTTSQNPVRV